MRFFTHAIYRLNQKQLKNVESLGKTTYSKDIKANKLHNQ